MTPSNLFNESGRHGPYVWDSISVGLGGKQFPNEAMPLICDRIQALERLYNWKLVSFFPIGLYSPYIFVVFTYDPSTTQTTPPQR